MNDAFQPPPDPPPSPNEGNPFAPPTTDTRPSEVGDTIRLSLADRGSRFAAALLDSLFYGIAAVVGVMVIVLLDLGGGKDVDFQFVEDPDTSLIFYGVVGALMLALFIYNAVLLTKEGQTIGKRLMRIRIVGTATGQPPGFVSAVLLRTIVVQVINQFCFLFGLIDVCFIFRQDRRCLHDLMASTLVVNVKSQRAPRRRRRSQSLPPERPPYEHE